MVGIIGEMKLYKGDCLDFMKELEDGSIDLILCDLPFGLMKNIGEDDGRFQNGMLGKFDWDDSVDLEKFFFLSEKLLRESGRLILFGIQPFTTTLVNHATLSLPFAYSMIWEKDHFGAAFQAKRAPLNFYEDILVFTKRYDSTFSNPLRQYFEWLLKHIGKSKARLIMEFGQKADHTFRTRSTQFKLCTEETYNEIVEKYQIQDNEKFMPYDLLKKINDQYAQTFNLSDEDTFKSNILKYPRDSEKHHPTQKPVDLLVNLIETFTNEDDVVADFTMGSGSTGVAARKTNRIFLGSELDEDFYDIAYKRIQGEI